MQTGNSGAEDQFNQNNHLIVISSTKTDLNLNVLAEQKLQCTVLSGSNMLFAVIYQLQRACQYCNVAVI